MSHVEAFALSNSYFFRPLVKFPGENNLRKRPVNAELFEFVIKRRSANHTWRPSSKAAPKTTSPAVNYLASPYTLFVMYFVFIM